MEQSKPQYSMPGEHNTPHSDMLPVNVNVSPSDRDIIKRIIQDNKADVANRVSTDTRITMADNTRVKIADKPSGIERSDGGGSGH